MPFGGRTSITDLGPHELWDEPWEGLPEEEGAWEWDSVGEQENGPTKTPPDSDAAGIAGTLCTTNRLARTTRSVPIEIRKPANGLIPIDLRGQFDYEASLPHFAA